MLSISLMMFLEPFKAAAAEGAVLELKMRILAGKVPALQKYAHDWRLQDIEIALAEHFASHLSGAEIGTLGLCRQLRNKVLHGDFHAARGKLHELGETTAPGGVRKIAIPEVTLTAISEKIRAAKAGTEGKVVLDSSSTGEGGILGWFLAAGNGGLFQQATDVFKKAGVIIDKLTDIDFP